MRRVCALAVTALSILVVSGAGGGNGDPPPQCGTYEYLTNLTCLIQSGAATFTLEPHE